MPLTKNKLNEMYWTGYCDATIRQASETDDTPAGRDRRLKWVQSHFNNCDQCKLANVVRALEYETAASMGPEMAMLFQNGGDVTGLPGFREAMEQTLERAISQGIVTPHVYGWMLQVASLHGKDWPGLQHVEVAPTS